MADTNLAANPQDGSDVVANLSPEAAPDEQTLNPTETENQEEEGQAPQGQTPADESEEIEHEGQKYRVPTALKGAFMMHADYTRKTMEVAEQRRAIDEQAATLTQQAEAQRQHFQDIANLYTFDKRLEEFSKINWPALQAQNPAEAQSLWFAYQQTKLERDSAHAQLQDKVTKQAQSRAAQEAKRRDEGRAILARDIKDWSPEMPGKLTDYGVKEFGFTAQEISSVTDPRLIKVLHRAFTADQAARAAAAAANAAKTVQAANGAKPVPQVGSNARSTVPPPTTPQSDRTKTEDWMRQRNEQLRKQGTR